MMIRTNFLGLKGLQNLKEYVKSPDSFVGDTMYSNIIVELVEYSYLGEPSIRLEIRSNSKTCTQKLEDINKIYKIVRNSNDYMKLELIIKEENLSFYDIKQKDAILEAELIIEL